MERLDLRNQDRVRPNLDDLDRPAPELEQPEVEFEIPTDALVDWIRANQGPLDPGVRAHFQYVDGHLTAKTEASVDGRSYGLQLMHIPGGSETHIALLDGDLIFYFIDPGLQQRASYFQKGLVRRDLAELVILVESEDLSARSTEALRFFEIFLSWWAGVQEAS